METQKESGLGELLKSEREKRGFSQDRVAKIIRLRKHFIEALEKEEWDSLPSPVFVKGFIRSYAQAVGFDGKEAISLYERSAPIKEEVPTPLSRPKDSKLKTISILIPLIIILAVFIYLWAGYRVFFFEDEADVFIEKENKEKTSIKQKSTKSVSSKQEDRTKAYVKKEEEFKQPPTPPVEIQGSVVEQVSSPPPVISNTTNEGMEESARVPSEEELMEPPVEENTEEASIVQPSEPVPATDEFVLTGVVRMRTYVKIYVDNQLPKEYIFHPGSRPQWYAKKGFNVVVGNAAGIEFDFNGKIVKDLGKLGKVVRINFPEDFESSIYEE